MAAISAKPTEMGRSLAAVFLVNAATEEAMSDNHLDRIFAPKSIAVVGATSRQGSVGRTILNNLTQAGFAGALHPINLKRPEVLGLQAFRRVGDIPDPPDLAVVCTPAPTVPGIIRECGEAGVGGIVIISAGFREAGPSGKILEAALKSEADRWPRLRIVGPNCLGVLCPRVKLNASFAAAMPKAGKVAFLSQSGALCTAILDWSLTQNVGFSHFVSIGNALDVDFSDLIEYLAHDADTASVVLYVESVAKARDFLEASRAFTASKPIVAYKAGRFPASAKAAASHTGAMAGMDAVYDAAFRRAGIVRVDDSADMFDCAELLATHRLPSGSKLAIVTNAGGPGIMAADELLKNRGELATLSAATLQQLDKSLPPHWSHANPVDVLGDADPQRFAHALEIVLAAPEVDAVLAILAPLALMSPTPYARELVRLSGRIAKPVLAAWMGGASVEESHRRLAAAGVATYSVPEQAIRAFVFLDRYFRNRNWHAESRRAATRLPLDVDRETARQVIAESLAQDKHVLAEDNSKAILAAYGLTVTRPRLARTVDEALILCRETGYPTAMKLQSPDISHKTEVGGVKLGIADERTARQAYERIMQAVRVRRPTARIDGITVQPMASSPTGVELIAGAKRDPVFGPVILVGAGGILAELLGDQALELVPINDYLARSMLESLRAWPLLSGFRGRPPVNVDRLVECLLRISCLVTDNAEILELDVNPLLATPDGVVALDARIVISSSTQGKS
jgi:acetyltransferase